MLCSSSSVLLSQVEAALNIFDAGKYIASGSDDGRWFIWEKKTGRLIKMLHADESGN